MISADTSGAEGDRASRYLLDNEYGCDVSSDGKYVVFTSKARNFVSPAETTDDIDVFLRDRSNLSSKTTTMVSTAAYAYSQDATISDDGNYIAFEGSLNSDHAIRVYDRRSTALRTLPGSAGTQYPDISGDGRYVVSISDASGYTRRPFINDWIAPAQLNSGDFNADGFTDLAFFRPSTGEWFVLRSEDGSYYSFPFGLSTDLPSPGDYDNDGKYDAAVYRPSNGTWYVERSSLGTWVKSFGLSADKPIPNAFVP